MSAIATGIDRRDRGIFIATTEIDSGRFIITGLRCCSDTTNFRAELSELNGVGLAVPEPLAIVKSVVIDAGDIATREDRVRFEMTASMLDDEEQSLLTIQTTGNDCHYLGMILRRDRAAKVCESLGCDLETDNDRLSFQLRSIGLGRGYLAFCQKEEAELVCLVDLTGGVASICLVYGSNIVDVSSLATDTFDLANETGREQFAVDLKTVINYRQVTLSEIGISVPLSSLLLVGDQVDDDFRRIVQTYFPIGVRAPKVHDGFLAGVDLESAESLPLFLVALGLAVK